MNTRNSIENNIIENFHDNPRFSSIRKARTMLQSKIQNFRNYINSTLSRDI